jgi:hypothetical protein
VDITVPIPKGTKSRELDIVLKKGELRVGFKGKEPIFGVCFPVIKAFRIHT